MAELLSSIGQYWTRRAPSYTDVIKKNLTDGWEQVWADELISHFPDGRDRPLRVLDIGTGPGFYAIILARRGYEVTAVDYSEAFSHAIASVCRGAGKAFVPMTIMLGVWCVFRILYITAIMHWRHEIVYVYWAYPITWAISSVIYLFYFLFSNWQDGFDPQPELPEHKHHHHLFHHHHHHHHHR